MRIQHNIMAMNAYRNYNINTKALSGNLEKLSSGYKINRAGDDAAGLAISEKMRAQITGLNAAQKNVKDGISLVKTAEGAMQEIQDMLNRMDYLATQSANGTYQDEVDRENLQKEVTALKTEINRIAESANFNGIQLLDGSKDGESVGASNFEFTGLTDLAIQNAGATQGTSTIVHKDGKEAKGTVFEIELSDISIAKSGAGTNTTTGITISVGGAALTANVDIGAKGEDIAGAFDSTTVAIGGMVYDVAADGDKLVFTMQEDSAAAATAAASFNGNFTATVTTATDGVAEGKTAYASSNIQTGNAEIKSTLADTTITTALTTATITDGGGIKVGDETYVFALKKETADKFKDAAGMKVVDLTDLVNVGADGTVTWKTDAEAGTDVLRDAVDRITVAAKDNKMFVVEHTATKGQLGFREQTDYAKNGGTADLSSKDAIQKQIQKFSAVTIPEPDPNAPKALTLQIGDTAADYNQMSVNIKSMKTSALGIDGVDISTQEGAKEAIATIKAAINNVSSVRGDLGAIQNRLEHTGNNLSVMAENIQDAESTIRDTDVAEEMMSYVKNNILVQSAQAMLAQANQVPQGVLQLLG